MSEESSSQSGVNIAAIVVVNISYWMVMLTSIGLGAIYLGKCPVQPNIPVYLIVLGLTSILVLTLSYIMMVKGRDFTKFLTGCSAAYIFIFSIGWFITGTNWIYSVYPPSFSPGTERFCNKELYQFAFILTSLQWAAILVVLIFGMFYLFSYCFTRNTRFYPLSHNRSFYGRLRTSYETI